MLNLLTNKAKSILQNLTSLIVYFEVPIQVLNINTLSLFDCILKLFAYWKSEKEDTIDTFETWHRTCYLICTE